MYLAVIKDSDHTKIGNIEAQVGIELANGYRILKVNDKSVVAELDGHQEKYFPITSIYYTEAKKRGFTCSNVDDPTENFAEIARKFMLGEAAYQQLTKYGWASPLDGCIEQAGYDFANEVQRQRSLAITELLSKKMVNK